MRGWTTLSPPKPKAVAWKPNEPIMAANPTYQMGRRTTWRRSFRPRPSFSGAVSTPIRWKIVVRALQSAAKTASGIASTRLVYLIWSGSSRISAGVSPGATTTPAGGTTSRLT